MSMPRTIAVLLACAALGPARSDAQPRATAENPPPRLVERVWYDGDRQERVLMAPDQIAVIFERGAEPATPDEAERVAQAAVPSVVLDRHEGAVAYFRRGARGKALGWKARQQLASSPGVHQVSPVFYHGDAQPSNRMVLTGEIIIGFKTPQSPDQLAAFTARYGVTIARAYDFSPNTYLIDARASRDSLDLANQIYESGIAAFAYPNWLRSRQLK